MISSSLRAIFFDLDNTLLDHSGALDAALKAVCSAHAELFGSYEFEHLHATWIEINEGLWKEYIAGDITAEELRLRRIERLIEWSCADRGLSPEAYQAAAMRDLYMERYMSEGKLYEGVAQLLEALHERYILGIVSNGFTDAKLAHLRLTGLDRYFDHMILSESIGVHKPDRRIFQAALDAAGVTPEEALFVGDNFYFDIYGASQAGIAAIWLNTGGSEHPADLPDVRPVAVARSIPELAALLGVSLDSSRL